jgi:predicted nucleotidyltransferase
MDVIRAMSDDELGQVLPMPLEKLRAVLRKNRIARAWLFGSRSRGDHRADSDVDILYQPEYELGLLEYGRLLIDLDDLSPVRVDVAAHIVDRIKPYISGDLVRVL